MLRLHFHGCNASVFCAVRVVREILRWNEVGEMLDTIVSLTVCVALLAYLVYAMLRPEKILTMTNNGWFQILFFLLVVLALTKPLGSSHDARFQPREDIS